MRMSIVAVVGVVGLVAILVVMMKMGSSPTETARAFMDALGKKDIATLTKLTYLENPKQDVAEQWNFCVNKAAKNAVFAWLFQGNVSVEGDVATIPVTFWRFTGPQPNEDGPIELALRKVDGTWKVDLTSTSRLFFPALPE